MTGLREKVALVTGSSRGIGAAIAKLFAREGAKVAVHGRAAPALSATRDEIERAGGRAISVAADVTNFAEIEAMRGRIEAQLGPIDVLVANAGGSYSPPAPIEETTEEGWRASVEGNLTATFLSIKSILPGMKERRSGAIITVSSAAGRRAHPRSPIPYAAAKAGIEVLTQDVASQAGPFGVRVNSSDHGHSMHDLGCGGQFAAEKPQLGGHLVPVVRSEVFLMRPAAGVTLPAGTTHPDDGGLHGDIPLRKIQEHVALHDEPRSALPSE